MFYLYVTKFTLFKVGNRDGVKVSQPSETEQVSSPCEREKENSPVSLCEGEIFENDLQLSERFHKLGKHPAFMCNMNSVFHSLTCRLDSYLQ